MGRDIPIAVPNKVRALIKSGWGDIDAFASAHEFDYNAVYSLLVRTGGRRPLKMLDKLSRHLQCSREEVVTIFAAEPGEQRKQVLEELCLRVGLTIPDLSRICWGNNSHIYSVISGKSSGKQLLFFVQVVSALGLDLMTFEQLYKENSVAA